MSDDDTLIERLGEIPSIDHPPEPQVPKPASNLTLINRLIEDKFAFYNERIGELVDRAIYEKELIEKMNKKKRRAATIKKYKKYFNYFKYLVSAVPASLLTYLFSTSEQPL